MPFSERFAPVDRILRGAISRRVVSAVLAAALAPSLSLSAEGPVLAAPHQDLSEVVPMRILDEIDLSGATPKVESKPSLNWRPALNGPQQANTSLATPDLDTRVPAPSSAAAGNAAVKVAAKPAAEPQLKPVTTAPTLVAPQVSVAAPALQPTTEKPVVGAPLDGVLVDGAASEATDQDDSIKAADAPLLPLRAHRASSGAATTTQTSPSAAAIIEKAVEKKLAATPAPVEKPPVAAPVVVTPAVEKPAAAPTLSAAKPQPPTQSQPQTQFQPPSRPLAAAPGVAPPQAAPLQTAQPLPPLSRNMRNLRSRLRSVLSFYYRKPLNTVEHDPWELMHAMLQYELHSRVRDGGPNGPYMTLVGHLCFNRPSKRQQLMIINKDGKLEAEVGVGVQGHRGQFLAMLAQCNVSPEYPIRVGGQNLTIRDLIESEQRSCYAKTELTFKLIGLGHYLSSDATWVNDQGETWDIPRLIREERAQPIRGAACGGTHRLSGLSLAYRRREARGEPLDGEYAEAARFVNQYQAYALQLQNEDGSLSTEWFAGRGAEEDIERRLRTTGHILEWLVYTQTDEELQSFRTVRAVSYLTELLASHADQEWHLGSIGHAVHALVLYDKRVFRPHDAATAQVLAAVDPTGNLYRDYPIYRGVMRNGPPEPAGFLGLFGTSKSSNNRR
jgi:hypothetical protein